MKNKYTKWHTSWIKWSGDLWDRLENTVGFYYLLWSPCSYCKKYRVLDDNMCDYCPLYKLNICLDEGLGIGNFTITKLYKAWENKDYLEFDKQHKIILQALKDTRFVD